MCKVWILGILDFGDFGFWRFLEFGGLGILDLQMQPRFGCYIRKEDCARRPGSADLVVVGAVFGEVQVSLFVAGAAFGEVQV